jgi:rhodanese-related sulfurtransferase
MIARLMGLDTISPRDLHGLLGAGHAFAIDVNSAQSWNRAHVPGAINLDPWCRKAPNAARRAKTLGYGNVKVMAAGIQGWQSARLPVEGAAA